MFSCCVRDGSNKIIAQRSFNVQRKVFLRLKRPLGVMVSVGFFDEDPGYESRSSGTDVTTTSYRPLKSTLTRYFDSICNRYKFLGYPGYMNTTMMYYEIHAKLLQRTTRRMTGNVQYDTSSKSNHYDETRPFVSCSGEK